MNSLEWIKHKLELIYKYMSPKTEYDRGFLDGLDIAIQIIEEESEIEESKEKEDNETS